VSRPVVPPQEVAGLTRKLAELQHDVLAIRLRLEGVPNSPLGTLGATAMLSVEDQLGRALSALTDAAELVTSVTS
jgi:hypothetical protein